MVVIRVEEHLYDLDRVKVESAYDVLRLKYMSCDRFLDLCRLSKDEAEAVIKAEGSLRTKNSRRIFKYE